ncbi:hypothetical protein ABMA27_001483 [Loxostege sticticalis]|uniref:Luciferin 4-monooxygenase n=1 Tax=Loxostege sticticalis TaxID=481309 RepID=A0ABR3HYM9_LOXSC
MMRDARYIRSDQEIKVPVHLNFGKFILDKIRVKNDELALIDGETGNKMTYRELTQYAVNLASALLKAGIGVGDVVALCSEIRIENTAIIIGIILTGATCIPIPMTVDEAEFPHRLQVVKPKLVITSKRFWDAYNDVIKQNDCVKSIIMIDDVDLEMVTPIKSLISNDVNVTEFEPTKVQGQTDIAMIYFSSGTIGKPKGVYVNHLTYIANCSVIDNFGDLKHRTMVCRGDYSYGYDNEMTFIFLTLGSTVVHYDQRPLVFLQCVQDYKVNAAIIYPSLIREMTDKEHAAKFNLESIEYVYCSTSHLDADLKDRYLKKYPNVKTFELGHGMAETSFTASEHWGVPGLKKNSVGKLAPRIVAKVVDLTTREPLGPNQLGELCVEAQNVFNGYIGKDPSTYLDKEGFFPTGDLVYYDEDGYFYITDRIKDVIKFNGHTMSPATIEFSLLKHPAVEDAGVVGKDVPQFGPVPTAFIVKKPGIDITEKELIDYIGYEFAGKMELRGGVIFVDEIPRTLFGKIKRRALRNRLKAQV